MTWCARTASRAVRLPCGSDLTIDRTTGLRNLGLLLVFRPFRALWVSSSWRVRLGEGLGGAALIIAVGYGHVAMARDRGA